MKMQNKREQQKQRQIKLQQEATDRKVCARERRESKKKNSQRQRRVSFSRSQGGSPQSCCLRLGTLLPQCQQGQDRQTLVAKEPGWRLRPDLRPPHLLPAPEAGVPSRAGPHHWRHSLLRWNCSRESGKIVQFCLLACRNFTMSQYFV